MKTSVIRFLRRQPLGAAGGVVIVLVMLAAIAATAVSTDDPTRTNAAQTFLPPGPR